MRVRAEDHIGEERVMNNKKGARLGEITGQGKTGTALHRVYWEDGAVSENIPYASFKRGQVAHPKNKAGGKIGEQRQMNNGKRATIKNFAGRDCNGAARYNICWEDGRISEGVLYQHFKDGGIAHPDDKISAESHIGEELVMKNGMKAWLGEIVGRNKGGNGNALYRVHWEDGQILNKVTYQQFKSGRVVHPNGRAVTHVGEERVMNNGMRAHLLELTGKMKNGTALYCVYWEDGSISENVRYDKFKIGKVAHPSYRPDAPKGERDIAEILTAAGFSAGVNYIWEYNDENFVDNGRKRYMDFYIPDLKLFIEFNGRQHFEYIPYYHDKKEDGTGGRDGYGGFWAFAQEKAIDDFKWRTCKSLGCELWYFADDEEYTKDWRYPVHTIDELPGMLADRIGEMASKKGA